MIFQSHLSKLLVGLVYLSILIAQVSRSIYLDIFNIDGSRLDLLGFIINSAIGIVLLGYAKRWKLMRITPLVILLIFIILLAINVEINSEDSFLSVVLSRYGVFTWLLLGIWTSLALIWIRMSVQVNPSQIIIAISRIWVYLVSIPLAWIVYEILINRPVTESYQSVANNGIVLITIAMLSLFSLQRSDSKTTLIIPIYILIILSCFLVYAIALLQSTGILAFWTLAIPIILYTTTSQLGFSQRFISIILIVSFIIWITVNFFLGDLLDDTRFRYATDDILSLSSIQSRLVLLSDFYTQFIVSPILGDFQAEVSAGAFKGEYMHSLPLSLLTHSGIVGFILFFSVCINLIYTETKRRVVDSLWLVLRFRLFILIIILASVYAFFTWLPLWFFMGLLCVKTTSNEKSKVSI